MLKIFKYLMQQKRAVIMILLFLIIQAYCDLALPGYTSNIVDIGIVNSGISEAIPECMREEHFEHLSLFLFDENLELLKKGYEKLDYNSLSKKEKDKYGDKYSDIKNSVFYRWSGDKEDYDTFIQPYVESEMMLAGLKEQGQSVQQIGMVSDEQRKQMMVAVEEKTGDISDNILQTMGISFVKNEYEAMGADLDKMQNRYILFAGLKMIGLSFMGILAAVCVGFLASRAGSKIAKNLRSRLFSKVVSFSGEEMDHFSTASLITRSTNDIQQVQMVLILLMRMIFYAPVLGIGGFLKVMHTNTSLAWIIGVAIAFIIAIVGILFSIAMPKFKMMQELIDRVNLVTREILTGLQVIRAFSTQKHEEKRFDNANKNLTNTLLFTNRTMTIMFPAMMLVVNGITLLIIWFGGKGIDAGTFQVGEMLAFITYTMLIVISFLMLTMVAVILPRAGISAVRIDEVLNTEITLKDPDNLSANEIDYQNQGTVIFDDVSFKYPGADGYSLEHISFIAESGKTTAFIGSTGCGKSTLVNLIPRFYEVSEGSVKVDGIDVREMPQKDLRNRLGFVPQKAVLFSGTIDSNLRYGKENATKQEIVKAAQISQSVSFIEEKEEKYNSPIAQGGNNVSGGQKQRLSIARAIAKNPEIFVFDDSFSALDFKTDAELRRAMHKELTDATILIVAQRISTILNADQIIVLDEGKIVGIGKHEELLTNCNVYYQIASSQLSQKELESYRLNHQMKKGDEINE